MTKRPGINERIGSLSSVKEASDSRAKAGAMADQYRRVAGRNGATGDDARAAQYGRRAEVLDKIAKNDPVARAAAPKQDPGAKPKSGKSRAPTPAMKAKADAAEAYKREFGKAPPKSFTASQMRDRIKYNNQTPNAPSAPAAPASRTLTSADVIGRKAPSFNESMANMMGATDAKPAASRTLDIGGRVNAKLSEMGATDSPGMRRVVERAERQKAANFAKPDPTKIIDARARLGNDAHMGTTSHAAPPPGSPPSSPKQPMLSRLGSAYGKAQTGLTLMAAGAQGAHAFSEDRAAGGSVGHAAYEGMKAAAPSAAIAGAQPLARGLHALGDGAISLSGELVKQTGLADMVFLDLALAKGAVVTGAAGMAAKGAGALLSAAGKVALPAAAAVGAYQGAREDQNTARGIGRGVVRSLDPTSIVTGLTGHGAGLAERIYDAAFGKAQARFQAASSAAKESQVAAGKKGWANPKVQAAAQKAKGNTYNGPME